MRTRLYPDQFGPVLPPPAFESNSVGSSTLTSLSNGKLPGVSLLESTNYREERKIHMRNCPINLQPLTSIRCAIFTIHIASLPHPHFLSSTPDNAHAGGGGCN